MWNKRGFTLIEMVLAIVIISVGLAGVLSAFQMAVRGSADPLVRKQLLAVADEMMEEVALKPFAAGPGTQTGCARNLRDDIEDYNGYAASGICDIDGNPITDLATYGVSLTVGAATLPDGVPSRRVAVTVTHGSEMLTLVGYRTDWAS